MNNSKSETAKETKKTQFNNQNRKNLLNLVYIAVFSAIICICAQISVPLGIVVPFTLQTLGVFVAGAMLGAKRGTLSVLIYVLLGTIGIPVFAGFSGGIGTLVGPTGGFIIGFIFTALTVGIMCDKLGRKLWVLIVSMILGLALCYLFGTVWFIVVYNMKSQAMNVMTALTYCVFPFLIADAIKITVAAILVNRLDKIIKL